MSETEYKQILGRYLPPEAVGPVYDFMQQHRVYLHITRERRSKLGDYRWPQPRHPGHEISVNGNLNPYLFLLVLLHEMGHLGTYVRHGSAVQPHGHEWQEEYRRLLAAFAGCFPADALPLLNAYTSRVPLCRAAGRRLEELLRRYDAGYAPSHNPTLDQLAPGTHFRLLRQPERQFRALERRRTRWLCEELSSGSKFLVHGSAEVEVLK